MELQKLLPVLGFTLFILALDFYSFQALKVLLPASNPVKKVVYFVFWGFTLYSIFVFLYFRLIGQSHMPRLFILFSFSTFFIVYFSKLIVCIFLLLEDAGRLSFLGFSWIRKIWDVQQVPHSPARSAVISKIALGVAAIPFFSLLYGMIKGAYKYKIHKQVLSLKNLPSGFEGLKIVQISDVHAGSFYDKEAVLKGINMIMDQKPDLIFFTGDLVNNESEEFRDYQEIFGLLKAPMGIYSILGNHDYGDYKFWPSKEEKEKNLKQLIDFQKEIGWRVLLDEHVKLEKEGEEMAIIGIQNWSAKGRFPKYGNLKKAFSGAESAAVKLLLSHDPSHWEAEVIKKFPEIDVMFAGHTHGMQFGVEIPGFKWSPVQYMYKQWAGLYESENQKLYVNRGFGFIGYPGRVGIWPEISVFTLQRA
jgi:predicted MPP superfamily phosphohydrolase